MKIVLLVRSIYPDTFGGVEYNCWKKALFLSKENEVHIITKNNSTNVHKVKIKERITIHYLPHQNSDLRYIPKLLKLLKKIKPNIILSFQLDYSYMTIPIKLLLRIPIVVSVHGSDIYRPNDKQKILYPITIWNADEVICLTYDMQREIQKYYPKICYVIPNGVEVPKNKYDITQPHNLIDLTKWDTVCYVGRLTKIKRIEKLIEIFNKVPYECQIIGHIEPDYLEKLSALTKTNVHIMNISNHDDLMYYLNRSKIFVNLCLAQGISNTTYEAMVRKTMPIILNTDRDKTLENGLNIIVAEDNVDDIISKINFYMANESAREEIISNGYIIARVHDMRQYHKLLQYILRMVVNK